MNRSQRPERNAPADRHRRDTITPEPGHDPYRLVTSPAEPTVCTRCGALYQGGHWQWVSPGGHAPQEAQASQCPACRRIDDRYPAGFVTIEGAFLDGHAGEVLDLVRAEESQETREHPLNRVMSVESLPGRVEITTTDTHLPRRLVYALHRAYEGEVSLDYAHDQDLVRATWRRDDPHPPTSTPVAPPLPLEVQANDLIVSPDANAYLHERIERLRRFYPRIIACRVVLDAPQGHHQQGGPFRVDVHVEVPGADAHVTRQQDSDLHAAVRNAFDAAQRVLQDHVRKQRGEVSPTVKPERGRVVRLFEAQGYGFLAADDGHEVYFHRNAVLGDRFDQLRPGQVVRFAEEPGENGVQATSVDW